MEIYNNSKIWENEERDSTLKVYRLYYLISFNPSHSIKMTNFQDFLFCKMAERMTLPFDISVSLNLILHLLKTSLEYVLFWL